MRFVKGFVRWLSITGVSVLLLLLPALVAFRVEFGETTKFKQALSSSGVYDTFVDAVLDQSAEAQKGADAQALLQDEGIKTAARQAFTADVLRTQTEQVLDSSQAWLSGKTPTLEAKIDLTGPKQQFVSYLAGDVTNRVVSLPVCTASQIRALDTSQSILDLPCLPPGIQAQTAAQQFADSTVNSSGLLSNPVVTLDTLTQHLDSAQRQRIESAPRVYKWLMLLPILVGAALVVLIGLFVALSTSKRAALKRVAWLTFTTGIFVMLGVLLYVFVFRSVPTVEGAVVNASFQESVGKLLFALARQYNQITGYVAAGYLGVGLAAVILLSRRGPRPLVPENNTESAHVASNVGADDKDQSPVTHDGVENKNTKDVI